MTMWVVPMQLEDGSLAVADLMEKEWPCKVVLAIQRENRRLLRKSHAFALT